MPSVKEGFILPLVRQLTEPYHIVFNRHTIAIGVAGDYLCTYNYDDQCELEWIESYATIHNHHHYRFEYECPAAHKPFFASTSACYVTSGRVLRIFRDEKFIVLAHPNDVVMKISSGIRFLIEIRGNKKKTRRPVPLHINNALKKINLLIEPA